MFSFITDFFSDYPWLLIAVVSHLVILGTVAYLILLERKVASWTQDRIGPNRVGLGFGIIPWLKDKKMMGLGQPLADGLKFILKEDYRPGGTDKVLFTLAPCMMILVIIVSIAVLPWGGIKQVERSVDVTRSVQKVGQLDRATVAGTPEYQAAYEAGKPSVGTYVQTPSFVVNSANRVTANVVYRYPFQASTINIGVLFILAVLSLAVYGVVLGGWASNNKYSFLGALRATAQMISYEIPLGLTVLAIVITFGTLDLGVLVERQCHYWAGWVPAWNCFTQPVTFLLFLVCIHAEANRAPFDMAEAEQELVGGYHTEYSAMRFALFFLAEYAGMITTSAVCVALFFGGWHLPGLDRGVLWFANLFHAHNDPINAEHPAVTSSMLLCLVRAVVFFTKTVAIIFVFMWSRWSLPRFRFDQLMMLAWRALIPISLGLLVVTTLAVWAFGEPDLIRYGVHGRLALALLAGNVLVIVVSMIASLMLPAAPLTNRRVIVGGSRYNRTPLAGAPAVVRPTGAGAVTATTA